MMDLPLNAWLLLDNAQRRHGNEEIVTRFSDTGQVHRTTYAQVAQRAQQLMHALDRLGIGRGERVATLAWNSYRHLECYFGIPCSGRVLHTLNLRLSAQDLGYIIGHADDRAIVVDADLVPLLEQVEDLSMVQHVIVMGEVPETTLRGVVAYEELLAAEPTSYPRQDIPESTPLGLCYTSGTTGMPKGAVYTHRSTYLHALAVTSASAFSIGPSDTVLPLVPMFHANAWGVPYACTAVGAKQVLAAGALDPEGVVDLLVEEHVTIASGVPTIWLTVADALAARGGGVPDLRHIVCGGAQPPQALIRRYLTEFGVPIAQAWGMTETSPLATVSWPRARMRDWDDDALMHPVRGQAGLPLPGIELSIRAQDGSELPWDGESMGDLYVRGPWVIDSYLHGEGAECFSDDGWFRTGDVAIGSPDGYMVIADRTKDLIKSGGEWISSVEMEAAIMAMPEVSEAAVIAVPDPRWQERPLACVVLRPGASLDVAAVHRHLERSGFARWQLPDRVELIDEVPKTSVGKFDKKVLRARLIAS